MNAELEAAHARLNAAMDNDPPECVGVDLFTADELSKADQAALLPFCEVCPVAAQCAEFAALLKPKAGYWAGNHHSHYTRRKATK